MGPVTVPSLVFRFPYLCSKRCEGTMWWLWRVMRHPFLSREAAFTPILFNDNWESIRKVSPRLQLCTLIKKNTKKNHMRDLIIREQCARVVHQQWADSAHLIYTALSFYKCRIDLRAIPINHNSAGKRQRPRWNEVSFRPARKITGVLDGRIEKEVSAAGARLPWEPCSEAAALTTGG